MAGGASKEHGSSIATGSTGFGMGAPLVAAASGSGDSTTYSAISGGRIDIRDEAGQVALTGKTAAETVAALKRDTSDTLNALSPIFDKEQIEAGFEIVSEANRQVGQFLANRAQEMESAKARSEDPSLSYVERAQAARDYADLSSKWDAQGTYSQWGAIILGAAGGNVMGGTGQFVQAAAVNYLQTLGAAEIKELSAQLGGEGSVGHAALHAVLGCAGAAAQGASCSAGGSGALAGVVLSKLLDSMDGADGDPHAAEGSQARVNLIGSLVAGIAASIDPTAAVPAAVAAQIEAQNNSLYQNRDKVARMKAEVTGNAIEMCGHDTGCLQSGFDRADRLAAAYDVALILNHYPELSKEKADTLAQAVLDLAPGVSNVSALYELVTGKTATGDEANRYFAAIGLVPVVGGMVKKGSQAVGKVEAAVDIAGGVRFGPINPGPLPETIANTFRGGSYTLTTLSESITLYRVSGGNAEQMGQYWTITRPSGPFQAQVDLALKPEWGNTAAQITTIKVPAGQTIYQGAAASQGGAQIGGGSQVFIQRVDPSWVVR